jgi:endonuclease/exonuclease/phosphatase family metal-dependent hydrolase
VRSGVRFRNRRARKFGSQFVFPSPTLGPTATNRGFGAVDLTVADATFRVVNTHLEAYSADIRADQAREPVRGPLRSPRPVVLAGDLNSQRTQPSPEGDAYDAIVGARFVERRSPRFNCWFNDDLKTGRWDHNIDFLMTKPRLRLLRSYLTGNRRKTPSGLWASDHGGIVSRLRFP